MVIYVMLRKLLMKLWVVNSDSIQINLLGGTGHRVVGLYRKDRYPSDAICHGVFVFHTNQSISIARISFVGSI